MLLLESRSLPYSNFKLFKFSSPISMSRTDIPIYLALLEDGDLVTFSLYKLMLTLARGISYFVYLETVSDAAGLCRIPQLIKSSFTSGFTSMFSQFI